MVGRQRVTTRTSIRTSPMLRGEVRRGRSRSEVSEKKQSLKEVRDWLTVIIPPTTLITALGFWYGYSFTNARLHDLGIDASILQLSTTDYLVRSVDPFIAPAAVVSTLLLGVLGFHTLVDPLIQTRSGSRMLRTGSLILFIVGSMALLAGI